MNNMNFKAFMTHGRSDISQNFIVVMLSLKISHALIE